jgi:hypothetical protein
MLTKPQRMGPVLLSEQKLIKSMYLIQPLPATTLLQSDTCQLLPRRISNQAIGAEEPCPKQSGREFQNSQRKQAATHKLACLPALCCRYP